ncbi:MAG TPA: MBL fold metallo-hydrolase [Deltaproteobacteria bacterium]|nr:MBL fold metallo-hydrolase [Deltaproteobacteria bacterium]
MAGEVTPPIFESLVVGPLEVNCYLLADAATREAFVVDPGGDADLILPRIEGLGLDVRYVINTHGHFDHVGANRAVVDATGAGLAIHAEDAGLLREAACQGRVFGVEAADSPEPDLLLDESTTLRAGSLTLEFLHTPGHTRGSLCLFLRERALLLTGDTLFAGSVGRTDLPGGSYETLMSSIKEKILPLDDDVTVCPGHGPPSTVGRERTTNPFLADP